MGTHWFLSGCVYRRGTVVPWRVPTFYLWWVTTLSIDLIGVVGDRVTVSLSSMNLVYACSSIDPTSQSHQLTGEIWRILSSNFFVKFHEWFVSGMKLSQAWHEVEFVSKFSILHCDFFFRPGFHGVVDLMVLLRSSEFNQDLITWLQGFLGSKRETRNKKWQTSVLPPCQFNQQWKGNFIPVKFLGLSLSSVGWISDDTEEILHWHFSQ